VYELRPYQREAVEIFLKKKRGIIELPTGTGKTIVGIEIWRRLGKPRMLWVVPTRALAEDIASKLGKAGARVSIGNAGNTPVKVVTYQLLTTSRPELGEGWGLVVLDEVHHAGAERFFERAMPYILKNEHVLGLSASPRTTATYSKELLEVLPVIYRKTWRHLREYRPYTTVYLVAVELPDKLRGAYNAAMREMAELRARGSFRTVADASRILNNPQVEGWRKGMAGRYVKLFSAVKKILQKSEEKKLAVLEIVRMHLDEPRILLFAETIDDLVGAIDLLNRNGISAFAMTSRTVRKNQIKRVLKDFGGKFKVLGLVRMGEEGLDFPDVSTLIVMGSPRSRRAIVQRSGRALRWLPSKVSRIYVIYHRDTVEEEAAREYVRQVDADEVVELELVKRERKRVNPLQDLITRYLIGKITFAEFWRQLSYYGLTPRQLLLVDWLDVKTKKALLDKYANDNSVGAWVYATSPAGQGYLKR